MEFEKKSNKTVLVACVLIVVVIIAVVLCLTLKKDNNNDEPNNNGGSNGNNPSNGQVEEIGKIFSAKSRYSDIKADVNEYTDFFGTKYTFSVDVPYIKIDGEDVEKINGEIKSLYESYVNTYNECAKLDGRDDKLSCNIEVNFSYTIVDDIMSVIINKDYRDNLGVYPVEYVGYVIDMNTGKELSYKEVLAKKNLTTETVKTKIMENYNSILTSLNVTATAADTQKTTTAAAGTNVIYLTSDGKVTVYYKAYITASVPNSYLAATVVIG